MKLGKINRNVRVFYLADAFYYGSFDILNAFLAVLITAQVTSGRLDAVGFVVGYYMLLRAVIEIPLSKIMSKHSDQLKIRLIIIGSVIYGLLIATLGFADSLIQIIAIQTGLAVIDALVYPLKWSIFTKILDSGNEETEWSIEDSISTFATAGFSIFAGVLSQNYGLKILFITMGFMFAMSGLVFKFMILRKKKLMKS